MKELIKLKIEIQYDCGGEVKTAVFDGEFTFTENYAEANIWTTSPGRKKEIRVGFFRNVYSIICSGNI